MRIITSRRTITSCLFLLTAIGTTTRADIAVIVHPSNAVAQASTEEVSKFFLAKTKTFNNGNKIELLDLEEGNETRNQFYQSVSNKTPSQVKAYWSRLIFTGKGQPPQVFMDSDEIVEAIAETENGIGYIHTNSLNDSVKVILTIKN